MASKMNPAYYERWVLISTILASSMAFIDGSALNVALDALQRDLGASGAQLLWVVDAYMLVLASLILLGGSLGDKFGRKRIFAIGIAVFAAASFVCGISPTIDVLIAARIVQGVGGALMVPGSLALISALFRPERRGAAIGTWSTFSTLTTLGAPILGGALASAGLWRFVFFINLPLAAVSLFTLTRVPESRDEQASRAIDVPGTVLVALGLAGVTYGSIQLGSSSGVTMDRTPGVLILLVGLVALVAFVMVEARSPNPIVPLSLFRSRVFAGTNAMTFFLYGALSGMLFFFPLLVIQAQGYRASVAGFTLLPFPIILAIMSAPMGRLSDRIGPRIPLTVGPLLVALGFLLLGMPGLGNGPNSYFLTYFPGVALMGVGMGVVVAPLTSAVMGAVPSHESGIASGINNAVTRTAQVLALAAIGAVALGVFQAILSTNLGGLHLPAGAAQSILAGAGKLGATPIPPSLSGSAAHSAHRTIEESFIGTFRVISLIWVAMAITSAALSWLILRPERKGEAK